jgi:hypothetical protein
MGSIEAVRDAEKHETWEIHEPRDSNDEIAHVAVPDVIENSLDKQQKWMLLLLITTLKKSWNWCNWVGIKSLRRKDLINGPEWNETA